MPLPITEIDDFCEASFGGYSALFTEERIDRASLPEGIYAYDIRSGEGNDFGTIEPCVTVNHTGGSENSKSEIRFGQMDVRLVGSGPQEESVSISQEAW